MSPTADAKVVLDTNVLLVANGKHADVSDDCVLACIDHLESLTRSGVVVIDDAYRILSEYQNKTLPSAPKGVGDTFLKWLLQNKSRSDRVHQVCLTESSADCFEEFPGDELQQQFDPPIASLLLQPMHIKIKSNPRSGRRPIANGWIGGLRWLITVFLSSSFGCLTCSPSIARSFRIVPCQSCREKSEGSLGGQDGSVFPLSP